MGSCFSKVFTEDHEKLLDALDDNEVDTPWADSINTARFLLALQSGVDQNNIPDAAAELFMKGEFVCVKNYKTLRDSIDNFRTHANRDKLLAEANGFFGEQLENEQDIRPLSLL